MTGSCLCLFSQRSPQCDKKALHQCACCLQRITNYCLGMDRMDEDIGNLAISNYASTHLKQWPHMEERDF